MIRRFQQAMLVGMALLASSNGLSAADILTNQTAGISGNAFGLVSGSNRAGITLGIGATGYQLSSFTFVPIAATGITLQQLTISLYLFNGFADLTGTPIVTESGAGLFNDWSTATTANQRTFSPTNPSLWQLEANKNYALIASAPAATDIGFAFTDPESQTPTMSGGVNYLGGLLTPDNGDTWLSGTDYNMWGKITATAVPEPSTYALGVIATGVMAAMARRRKARA